MANNLQQYSELADVWWSDNSPFQDLVHLNPIRFEYFDRFVDEWSGKSVLDLGCGGGFVAEELARRGAHVTGLDPSAPLLNVARNHAAKSSLKIDYKLGSGEKIPADDASFDVVVCVDVLEHVEDLEQVLSEVRRVLKPDGWFVYDTINRTVFSFLWMIVALEWLSGRIPRGTHDWRKFIRPQEMKSLLVKHGFSSVGQVGLRVARFRLSAFKVTPEFKISERQSCLYAGVAIRLANDAS
jgi:2-polyprenyl-6-hydroxyphenyl methylase/3-demethylubiquinone-9 3-methyltransferase